MLTSNPSSGGSAAPDSKQLEMSFRNKYGTEMEGNKKEVTQFKTMKPNPNLKLQLLDRLENDEKCKKITEKSKKLS